MLSLKDGLENPEYLKVKGTQFYIFLEHFLSSRINNF